MGAETWNVYRIFVRNSPGKYIWKIQNMVW